MDLNDVISVLVATGRAEGDMRKVIATAKMQYLGWAFGEQHEDGDSAVEVGLLKCTHKETGEDAYILCVVDTGDGGDSEIGVTPIAVLGEEDLFDTHDSGYKAYKQGESDKDKLLDRIGEMPLCDELPQDVGGPDPNEEGDK